MVSFSTPRFHVGAIYASFARIYAYTHAVLSTLFGQSVGWIATGAKQSTVSKAFRNTVIIICIYIFVYIALIAFSSRGGLIHLFNYNYWSVQFWLFYNIALPGIILWQMYAAMARRQKEQILLENNQSKSDNSSINLWMLKTTGVYVLLLIFMFGVIVFI